MEPSTSASKTRTAASVQPESDIRPHRKRWTHHIFRGDYITIDGLRYRVVKRTSDGTWLLRCFPTVQSGRPPVEIRLSDAEIRDRQADEQGTIGANQIVRERITLGLRVIADLQRRGRPTV